MGGCSNESNKSVQEEREPKEGDEKELYRTVAVGQVQGPGAAVVMVGPQDGPSSPQGSCGGWGYGLCRRWSSSIVCGSRRHKPTENASQST